MQTASITDLYSNLHITDQPIFSILCRILKFNSPNKSYDDAVALIIKTLERTASLVWPDFLFKINFIFYCYFFSFQLFYFVEFNLSIKSCEIPL